VSEHIERALSISIELQVLSLLALLVLEITQTLTPKYKYYQDKASEATCVTLLGMLHFARGDHDVCAVSVCFSFFRSVRTVLTSSGRMLTYADA
jgi:hypothetical protein